MEFRVSSCIIDSLFPRIENIYIYIYNFHIINVYRFCMLIKALPGQMQPAG